MDEASPFPVADLVRARLFERRTLVVTGPLDDQAAGDAAAALMTLDATGDDPVSLHLDCLAGSLEAAFVLIDTIDLLGVPVHATCIGRLEGPGVGVLAVARRRVMTRHARLRLAEPIVTSSGTAAELEHWSRHHDRQLARFHARLARATGRPIEHIEADTQAGRYLTADEALVYGLVDEVRPAGPTPSERRRPFGFAPPPS